MLCKTIPQLFKTLRINSFPLRLNPVPQQNVSEHSMSLPFLDDSLLFYTYPQQLLSTLCFSHAIHCFSEQFFCESILCDSYAALSLSNRFFAHTLLFIASPSPFHFFSLLFHSITALCCTSPCHSEQFNAVTPRRKSFLSPIYQTSRLNRFCCSQVSDSLAVCSSHRGNLCSRC